jgi:hypothetical protein
VPPSCLAAVAGGPRKSVGFHLRCEDPARAIARWMKIADEDPFERRVRPLGNARQSPKPSSFPQTQTRVTLTLTMTGKISYDTSACPTFPKAPFPTPVFVVTDTVSITGNGGPAPFEATGPSTSRVRVYGGSQIAFSNVTLDGTCYGSFRRSGNSRRRPACELRGRP